MKRIEIQIGNNNYYYNIYRRKKKNGGFRIITAPCLDLKLKQKEFANSFFAKTQNAYSKEITGFMPSISIKDNAIKHINKEWVINLDIKSFFPSTTNRLVEWALVHSGMNGFLGMGRDELVEMLTLNGALPQGSPASPFLANYIGIYWIDPLIKEEINNVMGFIDYTYTRYADDITFSFDSHGFLDREVLRNLVDRIKERLISESDYRIAEDKIHVRHKSQRQLVTGIIVNEGFSIAKENRLRLRALMHKVKCGEKELDSKLKGQLNFVREIKPELYNKLVGGLNESDECKDVQHQQSECAPGERYRDVG